MANRTIGDGKYELLPVQLGRGAEGEVIKCRNVQTGQEFAAKISYEPERGRYEAGQLLQFSDHPNIVKIIESFEETINGKPTFVIIIELCTGKALPLITFFLGGNIDEYIKEEHKTEDKIQKLDEILRLFKNMNRGMYEMHKLSTIHRDIKPSNFLLHRS